MGGKGMSSLFFFVKENWILAMIRNHANNILLTRNLHFDSDVRQWSHPLIYCCIVCGLNRTTERVVSLSVTWLCFDFVCSHARCGCSSIVCLRFQDMQIKQVDCKMNTKIVNKNHFVIFLGNCTHKNIKPQRSR